MKLLPSLVHVITESFILFGQHLSISPSSSNYHFVHCFYQFGFLRVLVSGIQYLFLSV